MNSVPIGFKIKLERKRKNIKRHEYDNYDNYYNNHPITD